MKSNSGCGCKQEQFPVLEDAVLLDGVLAHTYSLGDGIMVTVKGFGISYLTECNCIVSIHTDGFEIFFAKLRFETVEWGAGKRYGKILASCSKTVPVYRHPNGKVVKICASSGDGSEKMFNNDDAGRIHLCGISVQYRLMFNQSFGVGVRDDCALIV